MPTIRGWAQHLPLRRAVPRTLNRANFLSLVSSLFSRLRLRDGPAAFVLLLIVLAPLACHRADPSEDPGSLVIYAAREEQLVGPVVERFREETGVRVEVKYGGTAQVAATLLEEGDASPADLFWTRDPGGLGALSGKLKSLPSDILDLVPSKARSSEGQWVGITARVRALVYNPQRVDAQELPRSLHDLTQDRWKNRVGWSPTSGPTQTMITFMRHAWGEEETRRWLAALEENGAIKYGGHTSVVAAVHRGEVDVGLVNHYYVHRFREEHGQDAAVKNHHLPEKGPGNLAMVSGAGVLRTARNEANAHAFLRYLLSAHAQAYFTHQTFEYPMVEAVPIHPDLTPLAEINTPEANMDDLADLQATLGLLRELGVVP